MSKTILDIPKFKELYTIIGKEIRQVRFIELRFLSNTEESSNPIKICGKIEIAGIGTMLLGEFYRTYHHLHFAPTPDDLLQKSLFDTCINMNVIQASSSLGCFEDVIKAIKRHFPTADSRYEMCWRTCVVLLRAYYWDGLRTKVKLLDWEYDVLNDSLVTSMDSGYYLTEQECRENNQAIVHRFEEQEAKPSINEDQFMTDLWDVLSGHDDYCTLEKFREKYDAFRLDGLSEKHTIRFADDNNEWYLTFKKVSENV